jgi:hypothetical protein
VAQHRLVGPALVVRKQRKLGHQHRKRVLRRRSVQYRFLGMGRRKRFAIGRDPRRTDLPRQPPLGTSGLERLAWV